MTFECTVKKGHAGAGKFIEDKIYIPYLVFAETLTVLTYKNSKELADEFSNFILTDQRFIFINEEIISELSFWKSIDRRLSYIDIVLVYNALKYKAKLVSFDEEMNKLYMKYS